MQTAAQLWAANANPEHWSGLNLIDGSKRLDKVVAYLVKKDYDRRNFYVQTDLAGIFNLSTQNFEQLCMFALSLLGGCILKQFQVLEQELKLSQAIVGYDAALVALGEVQTLAFADKILQAQRGSPRYFIQKGEPPL